MKVESCMSQRAQNCSLSTVHSQLLWDTALWYKNLKDTSNTAFMPLYFNRSRYLVLKGGGGSGKSIFAGRKVLERVTSEPGHRWLVVRKTGKSLRESCFEQLKAQAMEHYAEYIQFIPRGKSSDMYIRFTNSSEIIFAGLDDVEKLKSIFNVTGIWIEEPSEITREDFNQLDIRLRTVFPYYLQIILSFNPVSITHWLKLRFFDAFDPRATIHESTYRDNRFLPEDQAKTLEGFRDSDPYMYQVYCLGDWGVTGRTVFDGAAVSARLAENKKPLAVGHFEYAYDGLRLSDIRWTDDPAGIISIYSQPEDGAPYVIGGDTAGYGSDWFVGQVIDNRTGAQAAVLRHQTDEDLYAKQIYCLGMYYNRALVGIETNFSTYPVMELERLRYPRQYVREMMDNYTHRPRSAYGFRTDANSREVAISTLIQACRENIGIISDRGTLEEMLTFVRNDRGRPEAQANANDDRIIALAIAHLIRPQQSYLAELPPEKRVEWTKDMREDYERADRELKELLIKRWGKPS